MEPLDSGLHVAGLTEFLAQPEPVGADLQAGTRLGDVTIVALVGEGGMGRVYEGLQGMPCRTVAVKVMRPGVLSPAATRRFEHEAQILGRLTHPGIAHIYSVGMQPLPGGAVPYFVMEYIEGAQPITAFAHGRELTARDRVALFRTVCQAVAHGHQKGVIHRDLKPGNILVDAAGHPKVIDFGVARSTDGDIALTTMHTDAAQLVGTLQYMSPEQFDGDAGEIDIRADVYALGVVLYELLAGKPPYDIARRPIYDAARVVREVEPRSLATVNPRLRGDLATIVAKCLEKDRTRRYSSAAELEADLGRTLRGEPITASPPGLVDGLLRLARRHRLAAAAAGSVALALVVAIVGISIFALRAERERRSAVAERQRADAASNDAIERLYVANLRSLQSALDTRNVRLARRLYADNLAIAGAQAPLELRVLGARLDDALVVLDLERGPVESVAYSPDGGVLAAVAGEFHALPVEEMGPVFRRAMLDNSQWVADFYRDRHSRFFEVRAQGSYEPLAAYDAEWVRLWRAEAGDMAPFEQAVKAAGVPLAVSRDGRLLAVHAVDGSVRITAASADAPRVTLEGHRGRLTRAVFTADGGRLFVQDAQGSVGVWNTATGGLVMRCGGAAEPVTSVVASPNGARLAVIGRATNGAARTARIYAASDGQEQAQIVFREKNPLSAPIVRFSPDGSRLVTVLEDNDLHIWEADSGAELARLRGQAATVTALEYSPDGEQIATGAANGTIRLWDARKLAAERELLAHDNAVLAFAFRPDGDTLASASHDGTVRVWSRGVGGMLADLPDAKGLTAVAFSPDGGRLAVAPHGAGTIELWDPLAVERRLVLDAAGASVTRIVFAPGGEHVAAALERPARDGEVRVWKAADGTHLATLERHERGVAGLAFGADGSRLVTTSRSGALRLWEATTGQRLLQIPRDVAVEGEVAAAVLGVGGTRIASGMRMLFDAATGAAVEKIPPQGYVTVITPSPDGRSFASGVGTGTVYVTDFTTGNRIARLPGHSLAVRAAMFSADGRRLVTASDDGTARLWDLEAKAELQVFSGHEAPVEAVMLTPDGRRIVTASRDGSVRVWDASSGFEVCQVRGQPDWPQAVTLSPDGGLLVTAAADGPIRIHGLSNADVTRNRALRPPEPGSTVPRASPETPPDRPDPAG